MSEELDDQAGHWIGELLVPLPHPKQYRLSHLYWEDNIRGGTEGSCATTMGAGRCFLGGRRWRRRRNARSARKDDGHSVRKAEAVERQTPALQKRCFFLAAFWRVSFDVTRTGNFSPDRYSAMAGTLCLYLWGHLGAITLRGEPQAAVGLWTRAATVAFAHLAGGGEAEKFAMTGEASERMGTRACGVGV